MILARLLTALAAVLLLASPSLAQTRPNIIVVMTDDQDDIGSLDDMPYVQRMMVERRPPSVIGLLR